MVWSKATLELHVREFGFAGVSTLVAYALTVLSVAPLFRVHSDGAQVDARRVLRNVVLAGERTHTDDPAYGIRKLVEIAERSIAQPFDDSTTTVQASTGCTTPSGSSRTGSCPPGVRSTPTALPARVASDGRDGYVRVVFEEIRLAGACSPQVTRRLVAALDDLGCVLPAERRAPLQRQRRLLEAAVRRSYDDEEDI